MIALLSALLWAPPVGVERALADVAREMRCVADVDRGEPATEPCTGCLRAIPAGAWACSECQLRIACPEIFA